MRYRGTLPGYGDCSPPDDEPKKGEDWDTCDWCGEGAWLAPHGDDALTETEHTIDDQWGDRYPVLGCIKCVESGRTAIHPREEQ